MCGHILQNIYGGHAFVVFSWYLIRSVWWCPRTCSNLIYSSHLSRCVYWRYYQGFQWELSFAVLIL